VRSSCRTGRGRRSPSAARAAGIISAHAGTPTLTATWCGRRLSDCLCLGRPTCFHRCLVLGLPLDLLKRLNRPGHASNWCGSVFGGGIGHVGLEVGQAAVLVDGGVWRDWRHGRPGRGGARLRRPGGCGEKRGATKVTGDCLQGDSPQRGPKVPGQRDNNRGGPGSRERPDGLCGVRWGGRMAGIGQSSSRRLVLAASTVMWPLACLESRVPSVVIAADPTNGEQSQSHLAQAPGKVGGAWDYKCMHGTPPVPYLVARKHFSLTLIGCWIPSDERHG
jgi:hypothetical protein